MAGCSDSQSEIECLIDEWSGPCLLELQDLSESVTNKLNNMKRAKEQRREK